MMLLDSAFAAAVLVEFPGASIKNAAPAAQEIAPRI